MAKEEDIETHVVSAGCSVTTALAYFFKAADNPAGVIVPCLDNAVAKMPATLAQDTEVPECVTVPSGPKIPEGDISDRMGEIERTNRHLAHLHRSRTHPRKGRNWRTVP